MTSNEVVKSVAKKLKYYFEVKRLEDGFDLSDVHQPQLDHPPLKVRPAFQYDGLHDRALKHYFSQPEVRVQLTHMHGSQASGPLHGRKEVQVRRMLDNYMRHFNFQAEAFSATPRKRPASPKKHSLPSCYYYHQPTNCTHSRPSTAGVLRRGKKQKNLIGGWPTLRSVPDQHVSKGEAARLVNSATKILVAADVVSNIDQRYKSPKPVRRQSAPRSFESTSVPSLPSCGISPYLLYGHKHKKTRTKRPATAKYSWDTHQKKVPPAKPKAYDDSYVERNVRKTPEPRPRSPTPSQSTVTTTTTSTLPEEKPVVRPRSAKFRSRTVINVLEPRPQEEVAVIRSTQTVVDYDVGSQTDRQVLEKFDQLEEEVKDGPWCEYQVYVCTGDRIGSSTKAGVKLTIYGEKGRTKEFTLQDSKRHKIPFQKGKEDLFLLAAHHVGRMRKIKIGHDRPELCYAWYCEGVTVYDMNEKRIFQFPCERWLSGQDGDKRTYRILHVDRERAFLEALDDESPANAPQKHSYTSDSEASNLQNEDFRYKKKGRDTYSTRARPGDFLNDSDSDTSSSSTDDSSSTATSSNAKVAVKDHGPSPRGKLESPKVKTQVKDDYEEKAQTGPVITLHSATDSKTVDEIYMNQRGRDAQVRSARSSEGGNQATSTAKETEARKRLEREREMERSLLQGKSIHDAVRDGDLDRVKELLHHFPEMRDFKDESSWTPLHLAAARGNKELLKWLVTSDANVSAETSTGYNAMHIAAMNGHVNSMMLLQAMGSSIMGVTAEKQSALHLAAKSGHLECVKWLVANRAHIEAEDNFGRTPLDLAEQFGHDTCADFLRVCMRELSNPRSTFFQIHSRQLSVGLPPIEEDAASATSATQWKDDIKGHGDSEDSDIEVTKKRSKEEEEALEEKRRMFDQQQLRMEDGGVSFLDSIRQEVDD